ncbi:MAG: 4-(cytidine 5'-diphospho)-2-C-methyl-D-erythritol kinase [Rhodocyclaceae bacterium]|nr:4-(cytidine 5'-diphospho)-2-C-methyl-D-erythritol kinase [Rhodocyclaceae bacterium]
MNWGWDSVWPAPAKLNLFLHVLGRRADGYHLLQTVFCFIALADALTFAPRDDGRIVLATPLAGVADEDNLVVRAARALQKVGAGRTARGVTIRLDKRLPAGGGLGGGSSDAATTLIALNHLWGLGLRRPDLEAIGLGLGADVPVFVHGRNCFAEGIGERFTDLAVPQAWYLVTQPAVAVPTAEIFRAPELKRDTPPLNPADWRPGIGRNDLAAVAIARHPEIGRHLEILRRFGEARMSGSGACCFVAFADEAAARQAKAALPRDMRAWVAAGLAEHPLARLTAD